MNQYKLLTVLGTCLLAAFISQCALEEKKEEEATGQGCDPEEACGGFFAFCGGFQGQGQGGAVPEA